MKYTGVLLMAVLSVNYPSVSGDYCSGQRYRIGNQNTWLNCEVINGTPCANSTHFCCQKFCTEYSMKFTNHVFNESFQEYKLLKVIDLAGGMINELAFTGLTNLANLVSFDLSNNTISKIPSGVFVDPYLKSLRLDRNEIIEIDNAAFQKIENLQNLNLSSNELTDVGLTLSPLTHLRGIQLDNNELMSIDKSAFWQASELSTADLSHNILETFDFTMFKKATELEQLDLSYNNIDQVLGMKDFESVPNLNVLKASNNKIALGEGCFEGAQHLRHIDLSRNSIIGDTFNTFQNITNLTTLNLAENNITHINIAALINLKMLNLSNNNLNTFIINAELTDLEIVDLSLNNLSMITVAAISSLKFLNLSDNSIESLSLESAMNLFEINLSNNSLKSIDFSHMKNLDSAILDRNKISDISRVNYTNVCCLKLLHFGNNLIENIPLNYFREHKSLLHLFLNDNKLTTLKPGLFKTQSSLITLDLSFNEIDHIVYGTFTGLRFLQQLNLTGNRLTKLDAELLYPLKSLQFLFIDDNKITNFDFDKFGKYAAVDVRNVSISLGGNLINCTALTSLLHNLPKFLNGIYSLRQVHDSANVEGIQCITPNYTAESKDQMDDLKMAIRNMSKMIEERGYKGKISTHPLASKLDIELLSTEREENRSLHTIIISITTSVSVTLFITVIFLIWKFKIWQNFNDRLEHIELNNI